MRKRLVVATQNANKMKELKYMLFDMNLEMLCLADFPAMPGIVEDGRTLEENAVKKAVTACEHTKLVSIGEYTGLEIEYLNGDPGVYSARFAGPGCTYADNNRKVLSLMDGVPAGKRKAVFRCVIAVSVPGEHATRTVEGRIDGFIAAEEKGSGGFGYDPVFVVPEYNRTFAELGIEIKNRISHRAKAARECRKVLHEIFRK